MASRTYCFFLVVCVVSGSAQPVFGQTRYTVTDLGTLGGLTSNAYGINDSGQIVGQADTSGNSATHAFLKSGSGPIQDLNDLIDPASRWTLEEAKGINDLGQIVGYGWTGGPNRGPNRAFLLTPVPKPSTLVLCSGLGVVGLLVMGRWWRRGGKRPLSKC